MPRTHDAPQGEREFNRRYVEYARAHGAECPNEMLARDMERLPGAHMLEFSLWIRGRIAEFVRERGEGARYLIQEGDVFDRWLAERSTSGAARPAEGEECPTCSGRGQVRIAAHTWELCPDCRGKRRAVPA